jgi:hypothetical protein
MGVDTLYKESIRLEPGLRHIYLRSLFSNEGKTEQRTYVLMKNTGKTLVFEDKSQSADNKVIYTLVSENKIRITTEEMENGELVKESYALTKLQ